MGRERALQGDKKRDSAYNLTAAIPQNVIRTEAAKNRKGTKLKIFLSGETHKYICVGISFKVLWRLTCDVQEEGGGL